MAHQVFLSSAKEDADAASRVCTILEADGIGCWLGVRDLQEGSDPAAAILEAIRTSDLVLLMSSASANVSPTVIRDVERAIGYERPVLSLHLDGAVPNPSLEYDLNLWQWLDATGGLEAKREGIVAAVRAQLARTSESAIWPLVDAAGGVDSKQEEVVAAAQTHLAQTPGSAWTPEPDAIAASESTTPSRLLARAKTATTRRSRRRTWSIALGAALVVVALGLGLGLGLTGTSGHQGAWTNLDAVGLEPPGGSGVGMVYEPTRGRLILFGGSAGSGTWAYDPVPKTWTLLKPAGTEPPSRSGHAMVYDPVTHRLIMFGGSDDTGTPLNDTWAYDPVANTWTKLKATGTLPPTRSGHALVYDPVTHRLIMFGGMGTSLNDPNAAVSLNDTWAYDPGENAWTELKPTGALPTPRAQYVMAYDPSAGRMVMFGGRAIMGSSTTRGPTTLPLIPGPISIRLGHCPRSGGGRRWPTTPRGIASSCSGGRAPGPRSSSTTPGPTISPVTPGPSSSPRGRCPAHAPGHRWSTLRPPLR